MFCNGQSSGHASTYTSLLTASGSFVLNSDLANREVKINRLDFDVSNALSFDVEVGDLVNEQLVTREFTVDSEVLLY